MLAIHPHRELNEAAPDITASLGGPGWEAAFSGELELGACTLANFLSRPAKCLRAVLPEAIRPGMKYQMRGKAPMGRFTGEMTVPATPSLLEPPDSLRLLVPDRSTPIEIPIRYRIGAEIGTLLADVLNVFETRQGGSERMISARQLGPFPHPVEGAEADTITILQTGRPLRFSLRVLGIGWNYTNFLQWVGLDPLPRPWPSFGIEGEGTYGYFDGLTPSNVTRIFVR